MDNDLDGLIHKKGMNFCRMIINLISLSYHWLLGHILMFICFLIYKEYIPTVIDDMAETPSQLLDALRNFRDKFFDYPSPKYTKVKADEETKSYKQFLEETDEFKLILEFKEFICGVALNQNVQ